MSYASDCPRLEPGPIASDLESPAMRPRRSGRGQSRVASVGARVKHDEGRPEIRSVFAGVAARRHTDSPAIGSAPRQHVEAVHLAFARSAVHEPVAEDGANARDAAASGCRVAGGRVHSKRERRGRENRVFPNTRRSNHAVEPRTRTSCLPATSLCRGLSGEYRRMRGDEPAARATLNLSPHSEPPAITVAHPSRRSPPLRPACPAPGVLCPTPPSTALRALPLAPISRA